MDIRTERALIPDPRIDRCKKHNLVDILLLCIIAIVCGVESEVFFGKTHLTVPQDDESLPVSGRIFPVERFARDGKDG
jgi:hypothetical protein